MRKGNGPTAPCQRTAASENRFDVFSPRDVGRQGRGKPYTAANKEYGDWATPMRGGSAANTTELSPSAGSPAPATPQPSFRTSHRSHSRSRGGSAGVGGATVVRSGNSPDEGRRLSQREKQVSYGYVTDGYKNMIRLVEHDPLLRCGGILPLSPPDTQRGSKRTWDIQLRKWRRALHMFDYVFIDGEDDDAERAHVMEQQRRQWVNVAFMAPSSSAGGAAWQEEGNQRCVREDGERQIDTDAQANTNDSTSTSSVSSPTEVVASTLRPCVARVRLSLETLMAVRHSPLVPTKLPVEDELRGILARDDCFEPVRNVVPQTASSLTRGTDISPLEAGIKIHIAPSAAVLKQQLTQQQRHQEALQHARDHVPAAAHVDAQSLVSPQRPSPSLPSTVVGGAGFTPWRRSTSQRAGSVATEAFTPSATAGHVPRTLSPSPACNTDRAAVPRHHDNDQSVRVSHSPAPRRPAASAALFSPSPVSAPHAFHMNAPAASLGVSTGAAAWSPPVLAPPPPLNRRTAHTDTAPPSSLSSPMALSGSADERKARHMHAPPPQAPPGAVMMMMVPTTTPDGLTVMVPAGFYPDANMTAMVPMLVAPLSSPPPASQQHASPSASRWRPSQSRGRADDPQTVPRFVPMLSASKEEVRFAQRMAQHQSTSKRTAATTDTSARGLTSSLVSDPHTTPHGSHVVGARPRQHRDDDDAQRALFTAADDDDEENRAGSTVARLVRARDACSASTATATDADDASLIKAAPHGAAASAHASLGDVSQDLFGH